MKLIKKFLTASLPVALVGVIAPTVASCSCSKKSFTYEYGEHINCLDKSLGDYHSRKSIANAAKQKTYRHPRGNISIYSAAQTLKGEDGGNYAFNDLIASITIIEKGTLNLDNWTYNPEKDKELNCDLTIHTQDHDWSIVAGTNYGITYSRSANDDVLLCIVDTTISVRSYVFYDCKAYD